MTVREMVEKYLKDNGYDGLYAAGECACTLGELMPCGSGSYTVWTCEPGYFCDSDVNDGFDFHIGPDKPIENGG